jgi:hypothetical protein
MSIHLGSLYGKVPLGRLDQHHRIVVGILVQLIWWKLCCLNQHRRGKSDTANMGATVINLILFDCFLHNISKK